MARFLASNLNEATGWTGIFPLEKNGNRIDPRMTKRFFGEPEMFQMQEQLNEIMFELLLLCIMYGHEDTSSVRISFNIPLSDTQWHT